LKSDTNATRVQNSNQPPGYEIMTVIKRQPRPKYNQRNNSYLNDEHINQVFTELEPVLMREARKIARPFFISDEDLVQEALSHIFANRNKYDETMASIKTWCIKVAKRKFYNVAKHHMRMKTSPQNIEGDIFFPIEYDDDSMGDNPHVEDKIHLNQLVEKIERRLHKLSKEVFWALLLPPDELIEQVRQDRIETLRERKVGEREKVPFTFNITNESLATYLNRPYSAVVKAKDDISYAIKKVIAEE